MVTTVHPYPGNGSGVLDRMRVTVPETEYGRMVQVPICKAFSRLGSCVEKVESGKPDGGYLSLLCDGETGQWRKIDERSVVAPAGAYEGARLVHSVKAAQLLYRDFVSITRKGTGPFGKSLISPPAGSTWSLPTDGVFSSITVGLEGDRREVFSTVDPPTDRHHPWSGSIDTSPVHIPADEAGRIHALAGGRAAAAFARVACRELGYTDAPFVTNCQGLQQLLDRLPERTASDKGMLASLCPELGTTYVNAPVPIWFEVRDPVGTKSQLNWMRANVAAVTCAAGYTSGWDLVTNGASTHQDDCCGPICPADTAAPPGSIPGVADADGSFHPGIRMHQGPYFQAAIDEGTRDIWEGSLLSVGPVPYAPSCDGSEDSVLRCFQNQMVLPMEDRRKWKRPCTRRILVGCSGPVLDPDDPYQVAQSLKIIDVRAAVLDDLSGFEVAVFVRPDGKNVKQLALQVTLTGGQEGCADTTFREDRVMTSLFPMSHPTKFQLQLAPQCRKIWSPYGYNITARLYQCSGCSKPNTLADARSVVGRLRRPTAGDGTWVIGDSVTSMSQPSQMEQPKIFSDTGGLFNCTTGEAATDAQVRAAVERLCWGTVVGAEQFVPMK